MCQRVCLSPCAPASLWVLGVSVVSACVSGLQDRSKSSRPLDPSPGPLCVSASVLLARWKGPGTWPGPLTWCPGVDPRACEADEGLTPRPWVDTCDVEPRGLQRPQVGLGASVCSDTPAAT